MVLVQFYGFKWLILQERYISSYNAGYNPTGSLSAEQETDKEIPMRHSEPVDTRDEQHGK